MQLSVDLDKLLPIEPIHLLKGIAFLYKRISELVTIPIIPRLIDRCINFLSNRSTNSATQTAIIILSKIKPKTQLNQLANVLWTAVKYPNVKIKKKAVKLYFMCLTHFPYSDDLTKTMMSMCTVCIQANSNASETMGAFYVISAFIERKYDIISEKFGELIRAISSFLPLNPSSDYFEIFAMLCESRPRKAEKEIKLVHQVMESNWDLNDSTTCDIYVRIACLFPTEFGEIAYKYAQKLNDDSYFKLISVHFGPFSNESAIIEKFEKSKLSIPFINSSYKFIEAYPHNTFKLMEILLSKLNETLESDDPIPGLKLICKYENNPIFNFQHYWSKIFTFLCNSPSQGEIEDITLALLSILRKSKDRLHRLFNLLYYLQTASPSAYSTALKNIDDSLLPLFQNDLLQTLLCSSIDHEITPSTRFSVEIFMRLRKICPLSTFNFFITTFSIIPSTYQQFHNYLLKKEVIGIWRIILDCANDLVAPYATNLCAFFLELIKEPPPKSKSFKDHLNHRKILQEAISIHIVAMQCIERLIQCPYQYDPQKIVDAVIDQLTFFKSEKLHVATLNTLRSVIRYFGSQNIKMEALHKKLFDFVKISKSETILDSILSVLGTIGPLDPLLFHLRHDQANLYPLYDKTQREQSFLDFVMNYLLKQLIETHEPSMLLNAVLYIFQFDARKSSSYLSKVINVLETLLNRGVGDSVFHILRSIILLVEVEIDNYAKNIYDLLYPYLIHKTNLHALEALSAMVFIMKSAFQPLAEQTFSIVLDILQNDLSSDHEIYLLQILTHLVIFCNCSQSLFFIQAKKHALARTTISGNAINFISQVIFHTLYEDLYLPAIHLSLQLKNSDGQIRDSAETLLSILADKCRTYIPDDVDVSKLSRNTNLYEIRSDPYMQSSPPPINPLPVSEIFKKNNFMQYENNWDHWLLHLSQNLVLCSKSPALRACNPLLQVSTNFLHSLFPLILISVWETANYEDREILSSHLESVSTNENAPVELLSIICEANDTMDRAGYVLFKNPEIAGKISVKCEHFFRAIRFYERSSDSETNDTINCQMIKIYARLQRRESALGIFNITPTAHSEPSILQELGIWTAAREHFNPNRTENDLIRYVECSANLEDWDTIIKYSERFDSLTPESKNTISIYFAAASVFHNMVNIDKFLPYINRSIANNCIWEAIIELYLGKSTNARFFIERGMKLNASNRAPFLSGNYEPALPPIECATLLEELGDVVDVKEGKVSNDSVIKLWQSKNNWIKSDIEQLKTLFVIRNLLDSDDKLGIMLYFLEAARKLKAWTIYDNVFKRLLDKSDDRVKLLSAKARYDRQQCKDFSEFINIIETTQDKDVKYRAICSYAARIQIPTPQLLDLLNEAKSTESASNAALKYWTYGNLYLAQNAKDSDNELKYAKNAMSGFIQLIYKHNKISLHYLCLYCSLCFSYDTNMDDFHKLPDSSIELIIQQLLAQFNHSKETVRRWVIDVVSKFADNHPQAIAFPLSYMKHCPDQQDRGANQESDLSKFIKETTSRHPQFFEEVQMISKGLLDLAIIDAEVAIDMIEDIIAGQQNQVVNETQLFKFLQYVSKEKKGVNKSIFEKNVIYIATIVKVIKKLSNIFPNLCNNEQFTILGNRYSSIVISQNDIFSLNFLTQTLIKFKNKLENALSQIKTLDINEISPCLIEKAPFSVAVPGFYNTDGSPYPTIQSFTRIVKMIPSLKRPRKIRITGSNGHIYKYLLKGKEDLILDQRVMQFFSLTNALLKDDKSGAEKISKIVSYPIVPLSPVSGLIAWAEGSETLYKLITWYINLNRPRSRSVNEQSADKEQIAKKKPDMEVWMSPLETKLQYFRQMCDLYDDTSLREAIWIRSSGAEIWFTQKSNFSRSLGLMSIVGYIIGLGDRHPNNILFMKKTGSLVHIDFSECFEKALNLSIFPEKVPFRLTRMMVKVLGVSGVEGEFKITAQFVMNLMRGNKSALLAFLDVFTKGAGTNITTDDFNRVRDKLDGNDFNERDLTAEEQVDKLIAEATNETNLCQMYSGWAPFW